MSARPKVTLLAGGVGGAKMAEGLAGIEGIELQIIGNVGDDEEFHGLWVSPDIDTLTYSLSGRINREQGWGVADESLRGLETLGSLGQETWMTLGDRDLGLHIYRTMRRARGDRPADIAKHVAEAFGVTCPILLPTDDVVQTRLRTPEGWLSFQEYFVRDRCAPEVLEIKFEGAEDARPTPEALSAIAEAETIIIAPSNPLVSIAPILAIPGIRNALARSTARKIAVSPLIAGRTVKGPAADMMTSLGHQADALGVARLYAELVEYFMIDRQDEKLANAIEALGLKVVKANTLMKSKDDKTRLAREVLQSHHSEALA